MPLALFSACAVAPTASLRIDLLGQLYRETYGWGPQIEVNVGEVTAAFLANLKEGREQCWVAGIGNVLAGSVFLTDEGDGPSRLRLLYVEPFARGRRIGNTLVSECVAFARMAGYRAITLWTHTILESARRIYDAHGFAIVSTACTRRLDSRYKAKHGTSISNLRE